MKKYKKNGIIFVIFNTETMSLEEIADKNIKPEKKINKKFKIPLVEKINLLEQIYNLLNSWIPITNTLIIIRKQIKNKNVLTLIDYTLKHVNKWAKIQTIFAEFPNVFTQFDISIIEMWEMTGKLWDSIDIIREKEEKNHDINSKIKWALTYPIIIIGLAFLMILVFMLYVIPQISDMYKDAKVNLPWLTQWVIDTSKFLQENIVALVIWFFVFIFLLKVFKTHKKTKIYFDRFVLTIPLFWPLIKRKILAIFTRTLWTLLSSWVLINKSMDIAKTTLENDYYEREMDKIISWVTKGTPLSELMWIENLEMEWWKENVYFPIELASIVKIWEQTWQMPPLLLKIWNKFNKEVDTIVKNLATAIEPIVIVLVWLIIWTLIMAIMLPFFNMVNVI